MASAEAEPFAEHSGVMSALRDNYARPDDANAVAGLVRSQQEVAAACSQREDQVKEAIKGGLLSAPANVLLGACHARCRPHFRLPPGLHSASCSYQQHHPVDPMPQS